MRSFIVLGITSLAVTFVACQRECCEEQVPVVSSTYVHKYGVEVPGEFWDASGQHGQVMNTMADGVVITRTYCSGLLDGDTTYSFPHSSQIEKREVYVQGTMVREVQYFFDGTPRQQTDFDTPLGMQTVTVWYLNGAPKSIEQISANRIVNGQYFTQNNNRDATVDNGQGTRLIRDDYGQLLSTDVIANGQLSLRTTYFPNGSPREKITYTNGVIDGERKTFYPAGEPNSVEEWSNGAQHGTTVLYLHGEKYAEVPYQGDEKHGIEVRYRDGTDVTQEISWNQGRLHGPTTTYIDDNMKTDWYYNGSPMSENDYYMMKNRAIVR